MTGPDRRKIREWMMAESQRRHAAGIGEETLLVWMRAEGYDEVESLAMLAEALGWSDGRLRAADIWPRLRPDQKVGLIRAVRRARARYLPQSAVRFITVDGRKRRLRDDESEAGD